jgi:uncharacterized protein with von Willebrand factor type A (vWA) domain
MILFLLLFPLVLGCEGKYALRESGGTITVQKPKITKGIDLYLLIDESGSMFGKKGTDQAGLRYEAGKYLAQNLLVKEADEKFPNRISVIHFGDTAITSDLVDLIPGNSKLIAESIMYNHQNHLGNTSFKSALEAVIKKDETAPNYKNPREKIVVIFTDGRPDDARKLPILEYFKEIGNIIKTKLISFNTFIVGIDNPTTTFVMLAFSSYSFSFDARGRLYGF